MIGDRIRRRFDLVRAGSADDILPSGDGNTPEMKLLIYSHFFAPSIGGVENAVQSLAGGLVALPAPQGSREFDVTVVTQTARGEVDDAAYPFLVLRQPSLIRLWQAIREADVIHIAGPALLPMILGLLSGRPVVVEHHGFQTICPNGQLVFEPEATPCPGHFMAHRHSKCLRCNAAQGLFASWKLWLLTFARRLFCARAAANITPTQWLGGLLHLPRVIAIPHGIDAGQAISHPVLQSHAPVIAFMGRLVTTKGVPLLFRAAKILHEQNRRFELLIIGDGPERAALEQFAQESQLIVRFAGRLSAGQVETALVQATVVVVPSVGGEVFGLVVAENMLRALPVVASDLGAFTEVLGETGLTFRTGDAADLATALARVLDNPPFAASLGQRARSRALHFCSHDRMIESHAEVYRKTFKLP